MSLLSTRFRIQISTASLSFIASSTMAIILFRSTKGLNSPYRRIIFGLSCSDILQSLAIIIGPFTFPNDAPLVAASIAPPWVGIGNHATCAINGFIFANSVNFVGMYTSFLCIYYVCKLHWRMSDEQFHARVERVLHQLVFAVNLPLTITALALDTYQATDWGICYYYDKHSECKPPESATANAGSNFESQDENEDTWECNVKHTPWKSLMLIGGIIIPGICCLVIICCAVLLSRHSILKRREIKKLNKVKKPSPAITGAAMATVMVTAVSTDKNKKTMIHIMNLQDDQERRSEKETPSLPPQSLRPLRKKERSNRESVQMRRSKVEILSRLYRKETLTQALLFVLSFAFIYILSPFIPLIRSLAGSASQPMDSVFRNLFWFFYPLGGLFNILVYCRPKVAALRRHEDRQHSDGKSISWMRGFIIVVAAGGEIPTSNRENDDEMNHLQSEFTEQNNATPGLAPQLSRSNPNFAHSLEGNNIEEYDEYDDAIIYRGDGMEWLLGDYYIEEETLDEIMYARDFNSANISGLSREEE